MELFPGRTLEELDGMDEARLFRALEARNLGRQCRIIRGWSDGTSTAAQFNATDPDVRQEYMDAWKRKSSTATHNKRPQ